MRRALGYIADGFLDALFPPDAVCFVCGMEARLDEYPACPGCAAALRQAAKLAGARKLQGVTDVYAALAYNETMRAVIHRLKYRGERWLARPLAGLIRLPEGRVADVIVPVPLHEQRRRERGYNQSALIARALGARVALPVDEGALYRVRATQSQSQLSKPLRAQNVLGAFAAQNVAGKTILLVDDVITTGSTLEACAGALKGAYAKAVFAAGVCSA
ncbi:MAG: ComF family protein [Clostridiales bacterium]|jgi:ComF family protein|nr:ComF family protein [Clostridiales bacterium]